MTDGKIIKASNLRCTACAAKPTEVGLHVWYHEGFKAYFCPSCNDDAVGLVSAMVETYKRVRKENPK